MSTQTESDSVGGFTYEDYLDADDDDRYADKEYPPCGCAYCFCAADTEYGEVCPDCAAHVHQG